jgi:hypothetical protein
MKSGILKCKIFVYNVTLDKEIPTEKEFNKGGILAGLKSLNSIQNVIDEEEKKSKKKKKNKFKHIGTLNVDQDNLVLIDLSNENDQKIDVMQSASILMNNNDNEKNEERKQDKKYTITLDNAPRRIKYIKEKILKEKKLYEKR